MSADNRRESGTQGPQGRSRSGRVGLTVGVTGAGGFVGAAVCAALEAAGHRVVRLARRPIDGHPEAILWDLRHDYSGDVPLPRVDAVVHCAAAIATLDLDGTARETNVGGSLRVAAAWRGVPLVYVSSASVYPPSRVAKGGRPLREDDATGEGLHDLYSQSKLEAERALVAEADASGRPLTILRPSIVYGPGDRRILPGIHRLRFGRWVLLPGGTRPWSMTPIGLLCNAARAGRTRGTGRRRRGAGHSHPQRRRGASRTVAGPLPAAPVGGGGSAPARRPVPRVAGARLRVVRRGGVEGPAAEARAGRHSKRGRLHPRGASAGPDRARRRVWRVPP